MVRSVGWYRTARCPAGQSGAEIEKRLRRDLDRDAAVQARTARSPHFPVSPLPTAEFHETALDRFDPLHSGRMCYNLRDGTRFVSRFPRRGWK